MSTIREQRSLGIIGGLGVGATVHYYRPIVDACTAQGVAPRFVLAGTELNLILRSPASWIVEPRPAFTISM
jgi:hypothetical protein